MAGLLFIAEQKSFYYNKRKTEMRRGGISEARYGRREAGTGDRSRNMDLSAEITKMNLYKVFEPYIAKDVTMQERMKGNVRLTEGAPEEARQALSKWKAMKMKGLLF